MVERKLCDLRLVRVYCLGLGGLVGFDFSFVFYSPLLQKRYFNLELV